MNLRIFQFLSRLLPIASVPIVAALSVFAFLSIVHSSAQAAPELLPAPPPPTPAPADWWREVLTHNQFWTNENIIRISGTPLTVAEVERERAARIWDSDGWRPKGGERELARRYVAQTPEDFRAKAAALLNVPEKQPFDIERLAAVRQWFYLGQARARVKLSLKTVALVREAGGVVPAAALRELVQIENAINAAAKADATPDGSGLFARAFAVRRTILFAHPELQFKEILANKNPPTTYSHNCDQYRAANARIGDGPVLISGWKSDNPAARLLLKDKLPEGAFQKPSLSYDATRFVFGFSKKLPKGFVRQFFLYEAAVDGSWVRQLTGTERDKFETWENRATVPIEDEDPCYLPSGEIVFVSSRCQDFGRCHAGRFAPAFMLYRCDKDGNNITQLSFGSENETTPSVLHDGRLLYTRWEYIDRHEMEFHKLWWKRPDGTMASNFYGNDTIYPLMISEARAIPGSRKILANAMGHHSSHQGTIIRIDPMSGENGPGPITRITPEIPYAESDETEWAHWQTHGHYSTPFPLNENLFITAYSPVEVQPQGSHPPATSYVISIVDDIGGREPIYIDRAAAVFSPIPVRPQRPPVIFPSQLPDPTSLSGKNAATGVYTIQDVYLTRNDPEKKIKRGDIKFLRFNRIFVKSVPTNDKITSEVSVAAPKRILGTVPVEADGSVSVRVPAGVPLQIQALDKDGRAILTERSFHYLRPGERRGCVGCHEEPGSAVRPTVSLLSRAPRDLTPPLAAQDDGEGVSFLKMVQPVLDKHCIRCHGLENKTEAGLGVAKSTDGKPSPRINLVPAPGRDWPSSYLALMPYTRTIGNKPTTHGLEKNVSRPYDYYAHGGSLLRILEEKHKHIHLPREDMMRIVNWLDVNAQCYGTFDYNRKEYYTVNAEAEARFRALVAERFGAAFAAQPLCALVNGARPSESRVLMAPLAFAAGGWEQIAEGAWRSRSDAAFQRFEKAVNELFVYPVSAYRGTCNYMDGNNRCICGSCWVWRDHLRKVNALVKQGFH